MGDVKVHPLVLATLFIFVGVLNSIINLEKTISEAWWYTYLPIALGLIGFIVILLWIDYKTNQENRAR